MNKKIKKFLNILSIIIFIFNFTVCSLSLYSRVNHNLEYKENTLQYIEYNIETPDYINYDYIRQQLNKIFNYPLYRLEYKNFIGPGVTGQTFLFFRKIELRKNLSYRDYTYTFTHELVHLTHFTINERYTSFTAFKILYESDIEYFHNTAIWFANRNALGLELHDYDCGYYIEEYLKGVN